MLLQLMLVGFVSLQHSNCLPHVNLWASEVARKARVSQPKGEGGEGSSNSSAPFPCL